MNKKEVENNLFWRVGLRKNNILSGDVETMNNNIERNVFLFYVLFFVFSLINLYELNGYAEQRPDSLLWPVFWAIYFNDVPWLLIFNILCFLSASLSLFFSNSKLIKVLTFVITFLLFSFNNSFGKINHSLHTILIPLFFFSFVSFEKCEKLSFKNLIIYYTAVGALLSTYFFAGFWKIFKGVFQFLDGEYGIFSSNEMIRLLNYMYRYNEPTFFANILLENKVLGFVMFWVAILIEVSCVFIFFKAKLHVLWGVMLLMMHVFIYLIMGAYFGYAYLTIIPLLIFNPIMPSNQINFNNYK